MFVINFLNFILRCSQAFYDLPPVREKRSTAFGYGNKYDFTKVHGPTPAPNAYNVAHTSEEDVKKKRGFSFGLSREAMAVTGGQMVGDRNSPGPGAYDIRDQFGTGKDVPGPGQYPLVEGLNKTGKYFVSKFKNSGATIIAPRSLSKSGGLVISKDVPGPGHYDLKQTEMASNGSYFVSKFKSSLCRSFGHSMRKSESSTTFNAAPGPGTYRLPSEFGYYEAAKAATTARGTEESPEKKEETETKKEEKSEPKKEEKPEPKKE